MVLAPDGSLIYSQAMNQLAVPLKVLIEEFVLPDIKTHLGSPVNEMGSRRSPIKG